MFLRWMEFRLLALSAVILTASLLFLIQPSQAALENDGGLRKIDEGSAISATLNSADAWLHQGLDSGDFLVASEGGDGGDGGDADDRVNPLSSNPRLAGLATQILRQGAGDCNGLPPEYRISCLAAVYDEAARVLRGPEYAPARRELQIASRRLEGIARANADPTAPPVVKGRKRITAVKKRAVRKTNQQARQVIAETETKLIRSAGSSSRRARYAQIAQAVGSTKNILRS